MRTDYTEDELIAAMRHSASRATVVDDIAPLSVARRRRPAFALPAAAAATVALTAGVLMLARHDPSPHPNPSTHQGAAVQTPFATKTVPTAAPTSSAHITIATPSVVHVRADISGVLDPVQLHGSGYSNWLLGGNGDVATGSSNIEHPVGNTGQLVEFNVVGPHAGFDASRIPRDQPVAIAGTTGYYSKFALFPLDGSKNDKYSAYWTIAFRTPAGEWAFVSIQKVDNTIGDSVKSPAAIVAAYDKLGVAYTANQSRVPLRTGYLPSGLRLTNISFATGRKDSGLVGASFVDGTKTVEIQLAPNDGQTDPGVSGCAPHDAACSTATAVKGAWLVVVGARGYDKATAHKILATAQVPANPRDQASYWTLADAFA